MPSTAANRLVLPPTVFAQGLDERVFGHRGATLDVGLPGPLAQFRRLPVGHHSDAGAGQLAAVVGVVGLGEPVGQVGDGA
jgi:hypothetical protein